MKNEQTSNTRSRMLLPILYPSVLLQALFAGRNRMSAQGSGKQADGGSGPSGSAVSYLSYETSTSGQPGISCRRLPSASFHAPWDTTRIIL